MSKKMTKEQTGARTTIGKIVGTHGVKGTILLLPLTDYPERFLDMTELYFERPGKPTCTYNVRTITPYEGKGTFRVQLEGINDKETAEQLKQSLVTVAQDERVELPEDEYWIDDMIGLTIVENESKNELGTLNEIMFTGSNDVYLVKTSEGQIKPLPATKEVINEVDIKAGTITVTVPEGLWD
ncbi:MAG: ribosome maturation factor RimM [Synergistaceae bacterium]